MTFFLNDTLLIIIIFKYLINKDKHLLQNSKY